MKKAMLAAAGVAAVFLAVSMAWAETQQDAGQCAQGRQMGQGERGGKGGGIMQALNLTPEQQEKLEANRKAQRGAMDKLREAVKAKHEQLQKALSDPNVTEVSVQPLVNEYKYLQAQLVDNRVGAIFAVKAILTPEQFAKFQQITQNMQDNRKERKQEWRDKKNGPPKEDK